MTDALAVARYVVFVAFGAIVLVALAAWLVRTRRVSPFSVAGRALRAMSDPLIHPVEARLVRAGVPTVANGSPIWLSHAQVIEFRGVIPAADGEFGRIRAEPGASADPESAVHWERQISEVLSLLGYDPLRAGVAVAG